MSDHKKRKSLIPYLIIGSLACFMAYIVSFVIRTHNYKVNLVSDNYYQKEIEYQEQIDIETASEEFKSDFLVDQSEHQVVVSFPESLQNVTGSIHLYRPSNNEKDFVLDLKLNSKNKMAFPKAKLKEGYWIIKSNCSSNGNNYYFEKDLTIKK